MKKEVRLLSVIFQSVAVAGLITGIFTNTAMPVIAGATASFCGIAWQWVAVTKGE